MRDIDTSFLAGCVVAIVFICCLFGYAVYHEKMYIDAGYCYDASDHGNVYVWRKCDEAKK